MSVDKKVLFIKLAALGDVIMALPMVRYLVSQNYHVTWVCGKSALPIVSQFSTAQKIIVVDEAKILTGSKLVKIKEVLKVNAALLGQEFDSILIGNTDPRYRLLAATARGPMTVFQPSRDEHHSYAYMKMTTAITGHSADAKNYWPTPLVPWQGQKSKKIALAPGGARNFLANDDLRRWPVESYAVLAEMLITHGYEVHIFGAPSDEWVRSAFSGIKVIDRIGQLDILSLLKEWSSFECLITHDSGPLHFGGLAGLPVIGLFGPTLPEWRFPLRNPGRGITTEHRLTCQPCYDGKNYAPCLHKNCLKELSPQRVFATLAEIERSL